MYLNFTFFFFFQAEDGIRDIGVTGVQTCALPISGWDSSAYRPAPATAAPAAAAASAPCPSPSTAATSTPRPTCLTRWRSPDSFSPACASVATPQSITGGASTDASRMPPAPFLHRHGGPLARNGHDVEVVHQAPRPRQPQTQPPRCRVPVLQRAGDVGNPGPLIARDDDHAIEVPVHDRAQRDLAPLGVHQDVAGDLGDGSGDDGLVAAREPRLGGELPPFLPGADDIDVGCDRNEQLFSHGLPGPARARGAPGPADPNRRAPPRGRALWRRP